jgi:hypothetical protein
MHFGVGLLFFHTPLGVGSFFDLFASGPGMEENAGLPVSWSPVSS